MASSFVVLVGLGAASALVPPAVPRRLQTTVWAKTRAESPEDECAAYWAAHGAKWKRPCEMLDVKAAWVAGELDGILPSGKPSRQAQTEKLISVARALELYDEDKIDVRRRYRNFAAEEVLPRFERILATRASLRASGKWATAVVESEKRRAFERAVVDGDVETDDASPATSRAVATLLSPVLRAAANTRNRADGGVSSAMARLQEEAGDDVDERWLTAALLAELESEVAAIEPRGATARTYSQAAEADRDVETGLGSAGLGVGLALVAILVTTAAGGLGGAPGATPDGFPVL